MTHHATDRGESSSTGEILWFVYGSSLDSAALADWCREHGHTPPDLARVRPARIAGHRLAFNVRSNFWGGLVASLVDDAAEQVEGILVPIGPDQLDFVRHKEGVFSGLYEEREAVAEADDGRHACLVYVASPGRTVAEGPPAPRFLATLLNGARAHGLSASWREKLSAISRAAGAGN